MPWRGMAVNSCGSELQHVRHDAEIDIEPAQGVLRLGGLERGQLEQRNPPLLCRQAAADPAGVGLFGGAEYARDACRPAR